VFVAKKEVTIQVMALDQETLWAPFISNEMKRQSTEIPRSKMRTGGDPWL
jgi:hypothetical protein